jgi:hypothetical protein
VSTSTTQTSRSQLWGIYYTDRKYACLLGDPLRTVVAAPTKSAAEEAAGKLGFESPWAHPISAKQSHKALWLPSPMSKHRHELLRKSSRGIRT